MQKEWDAPFKGWDFSYIRNRIREDKPPWKYEKLAKALLRKSDSVLDIGTGGGELFSSLGPFPKDTFATESYKPNVEVARKRLMNLGIGVFYTPRQKLPFENESFGLVLNRHAAFDAEEVFRVLKPSGIFLTQQVGGENLTDLCKALRTKTKFGHWTLAKIKSQLTDAGFKIETARSWKGKTEYKDVGAIVYLIKAAPWSVPGFGIRKNIKDLERLQKRLDSGKKLEFTYSKYLIKARKLPDRDPGAGYGDA